MLFDQLVRYSPKTHGIMHLADCTHESIKLFQHRFLHSLSAGIVIVFHKNEISTGIMRNGEAEKWPI
jgi:hypothetical protein